MSSSFGIFPSKTYGALKQDNAKQTLIKKLVKYFVVEEGDDRASYFIHLFSIFLQSTHKSGGHPSWLHMI